MITEVPFNLLFYDSSMHKSGKPSSIVQPVPCPKLYGSEHLGFGGEMSGLGCSLKPGCAFPSHLFPFPFSLEYFSML